MLEMFDNICFDNHRLETFKDSTFYNSKSKCSAKKLAEAGFYFTPGKKSDELDRVTCYVCNLRLFGWKKSDDPWSEHVRQNPDCFFIKTKANPKNELNIYDFLTIEKFRFHRINKDEFEKNQKLIIRTTEELTAIKNNG